MLVPCALPARRRLLFRLATVKLLVLIVLLHCVKVLPVVWSASTALARDQTSGVVLVSSQVAVPPRRGRTATTRASIIPMFRLLITMARVS